MSKRRTDDEVTRLLKDADRDLARGLTVSDFCRKVGVAQTTYHRWRKRHDPAQVDSERRCRQSGRNGCRLFGSGNVECGLPPEIWST